MSGRTEGAYRAGHRVRVRSAREILATLDERGASDGLPFMPEMLPYVGQLLTVAVSVQKVCWYSPESLSREMTDTVILEQLRCPGNAHGGCGAECRLYWKEAWLQPASEDSEDGSIESEGLTELAELTRANTHGKRVLDDVEEQVFQCQYTELVNASTPIGEIEPFQSVGELRAGNITWARFLSVSWRALWWRVSRRLLRREPGMPTLAGEDRINGEKLHLEVGELVEVRSPEEIGRTLDATGRHRGLTFTPELTWRCGKQYRVRGRVERLIDKDTGRMIELKNDCIALEGAVCSGDRTPGCWFCPSEHYSLWREAWLRRVEAPSGPP